MFICTKAYIVGRSAKRLFTGQAESRFDRLQIALAAGAAFARAGDLRLGAGSAWSQPPAGDGTVTASAGFLSAAPPSTPLRAPPSARPSSARARSSRLLP